MKIRLLVVMFFFSVASYAKEVPCYVTLIKNSCWTNYVIDVTLTNLQSKKIVATMKSPKGKQWTRESFKCELGTVLQYSATYSPVYWRSDKGKVFYSNKYWTLPDTLAANEKALSITICFPDQFIGAPMPPDAVGQCRCDKTIAPQIKLKPLNVDVNAS